MNTAAFSRSSSVVSCLKRSIARPKSSSIVALVTLKYSVRNCSSAVMRASGGAAARRAVAASGRQVSTSCGVSHARRAVKVAQCRCSKPPTPCASLDSTIFDAAVAGEPRVRVVQVAAMWLAVDLEGDTEPRGARR